MVIDEEEEDSIQPGTKTLKSEPDKLSINIKSKRINDNNNIFCTPCTGRLKRRELRTRTKAIPRYQGTSIEH